VLSKQKFLGNIEELNCSFKDVQLNQKQKTLNRKELITQFVLLFLHTISIEYTPKNAFLKILS